MKIWWKNQLAGMNEVDNALIIKIEDLPGAADEFGFPLPAKLEVSSEDLEITKRFLSKLRDETQSRGIFKTLNELLGRLP